jgi:hypothetical protein
MRAIFEAFGNFILEAVEPALELLRSRQALTHYLAFALGMVVAIVSLRCTTAPAEEAPAPEPVAVVAEAPAEAPAPVPAPNADAECVARVLYGVRGYDLSENAKTAIIEVIKNRVADTACEFRTIDSVVAACEQANQWQGYVSDGPYLREDYVLALRVLNDTTGARTIPEGCFFLVVKQGEVTARTEWNGGNEWRVS